MCIAPRFSAKSSLLLACLATTGLWSAANAAPEPSSPTQPASTKVARPADERPKKIYGHYMGCFPIGYGPIVSAKKSESKLRHDSEKVEAASGGRFKTWPLLSSVTKLTPAQSADLEIRRALRTGLDGFAIDAWAGDKTARDTLDALFAAAEAADHPFEITICLDPFCLQPRGKEGYLSAIRYLLDKHGDSPKLARRDGKPLIFGYSSEALLRSQFPLDTKAKWNAFAGAYKELEEKAGRPLFFHVGIEHFTNGVEWGKTDMTKEEMMIRVAETIGKNLGAVGLFLDSEFIPYVSKISEAARAGGADWAPPITVQYDNILGSLQAPAGTASLRNSWERAVRDNATLIQVATWNDYGEHTSLAPTFGAGYGFGLLNAYYVQTWKSGKAPAITRDQVYVTYRKHLRKTKPFPFPPHRGAPEILEVLTLLPRPAAIRLPGYSIEYEAPAGLFVKQVPLTPGQVKVEVLRDGRPELTLNAPEPVTDRPYREDNTLVCVSTEDARIWQEEFFGMTYPIEAEYRDDDGDGLPNWFEMYWFGTMGDFTTTTVADPAADPDRDGKSNLEEYLAQTDPTRKPAEYQAGFQWNLFDVIRNNASFNPDPDRAGSPVWSYEWQLIDSKEGFAPLTTKWSSPQGVVHTRRKNEGGAIGWIKANKKTLTPPLIRFNSRNGHEVALVWKSPVGGTVDISWNVAATETRDALTMFVRHSSGNRELWKKEFKAGEQGPQTLTGIKVRPGDRILFVQNFLPKSDANERLVLDRLSIDLVKSEGQPAASK